MRKRMMVLLMTLLMMVMGPSPALANPGGEPRGGSCGIGRENAHEAIADDMAGPGASEGARIAPSEVGCTGNEEEE